MVNSKSFVSKDFLQNKYNHELTTFELAVHFKQEVIGKHFTETSNKVELRINRIRINRTQPVSSTYMATNATDNCKLSYW